MDNSVYSSRSGENENSTFSGEKSCKTKNSFPAHVNNLSHRCRICNLSILKIDLHFDFDGENVHIRCLNHKLWHHPNCDCLGNFILKNPSRHDNRLEELDAISEQSNILSNSTHSNSNRTNDFKLFERDDVFKYVTKLVQAENRHSLKIINSNFILEAGAYIMLIFITIFSSF